ncbi:hypothetical protein EDD15DRAFT_2162668 [Pisolithus albus]|nr:hypothetical protein EDD15DRAFT_2162668 [Pisolithus albus]
MQTTILTPATTWKHTLLCWVHGDDPDATFGVDISKEANVSTLKNTLKHDRSAILKDVDAADLELYALFVPSSADFTVELGNWRSYGNKPLDGRLKLDDALPRTQGGDLVIVITYPTVLCWILGDPVESTFEVQIPRGANVEYLRNALKEIIPNTLRNVDAKNLKFYPLFVPSGLDYEDELGKWRLRGKKPLCATQKLSSVFPATREGLWLVVVHHRAPPRLYDNLILTPS